MCVSIFRNFLFIFLKFDKNYFCSHYNRIINELYLIRNAGFLVVFHNYHFLYEEFGLLNHNIQHRPNKITIMLQIGLVIGFLSKV